MSLVNIRWNPAGKTLIGMRERENSANWEGLEGRLKKGYSIQKLGNALAI